MDYNCKFRTLGFLSSIGICDLPTISMASLLGPNVASASSALAKVHGARCHCRPPAVGKATWWDTGRRQAVRPMIPKPWRNSKLEVSWSMEFDTMGCLTSFWLVSFWRFSCMYVLFCKFQVITAGVLKWRSVSVMIVMDHMRPPCVVCHMSETSTCSNLSRWGFHPCECLYPHHVE